MFKKGDYIIYETAGTCLVKDVTTVDIDWISKDRLFYILEPLSDKGSKIMTPVDSNKSFMRSILKEADVYRLMANLDGIGQPWVANDRQRREIYKAALKSCDCKEWIGIIKNLHRKKHDRHQLGKKLTGSDETVFAKAKEFLYGELSISLGLSREQVEEFVVAKMNA